MIKNDVELRTTDMSWISPTFDDEGPSILPPKKKVKTVKSIKSSVETINLDDIPKSSFNWIEQFKPSSSSDLAVQVKKVTEFETWLKQASYRNSKTKCLLITGPSGCGKTTMIQTVCKSNGVKVQEWITPLDRPNDEYDTSTRFDYSKNAAKLFEEFLFKSSRYTSCLGSDHTKKLILVKDFPNFILHNPSTFHEILANLKDKCMTPIVFISCETLSRKLFPTQLKNDCQIQSLALNPITDQRMFKVIKNLLLQEVKRESKIKMMSNETLMEICNACQGDLRSAISKLYFCSINNSPNKQLEMPREQLKSAKSIEESLPVTSDQKLDFFRGLGRVLYPKRIETENHLRFVHSAEVIVENFQSEPGGFLSQLHENYPSRLGDIGDLSNAAGRLAISDLLKSRWQDRDIFSHYSLAVAVRGLMVANRTSQKARFEAFRKSQTSKMEVDSKAIELEGKMLFSFLNVLDYDCLIDILPHAKLLLLNLNQGQLEYIRRTNVFR